MLKFIRQPPQQQQQQRRAMLSVGGQTSRVRRRSTPLRSVSQSRGFVGDRALSKLRGSNLLQEDRP